MKRKRLRATAVIAALAMSTWSLAGGFAFAEPKPPDAQPDRSNTSEQLQEQRADQPRQEQTAQQPRQDPGGTGGQPDERPDAGSQDRGGTPERGEAPAPDPSKYVLEPRPGEAFGAPGGGGSPADGSGGGGGTADSQPGTPAVDQGPSRSAGLVRNPQAADENCKDVTRPGCENADLGNILKDYSGDIVDKSREVLSPGGNGGAGGSDPAPQPDSAGPGRSGQDSPYSPPSDSETATPSDPSAADGSNDGNGSSGNGSSGNGGDDSGSGGTSGDGADDDDATSSASGAPGDGGGSGSGGGSSPQSSGGNADGSSRGSGAGSPSGSDSPSGTSDRDPGSAFGAGGSGTPASGAFSARLSRSGAAGPGLDEARGAGGRVPGGVGLAILRPGEAGRLLATGRLFGDSSADDPRSASPTRGAAAGPESSRDDASRGAANGTAGDRPGQFGDLASNLWSDDESRAQGEQSSEGASAPSDLQGFTQLGAAADWMGDNLTPAGAGTMRFLGGAGVGLLGLMGSLALITRFRRPSD